MRVGAKLRNYGRGVSMRSVVAEARRAEAAGFDSVWLSDHLAMPETTRSRYPYGPGGVVSWAADEPWLEPVVLLSALALATEQVSLGTAVLVLPLREPLHLAKQLGCVQQLSGGRVVLGVGDGWLREELELLGVDFERRRERTDVALTTLAAAWSGAVVDQREGRAHRYRVEPRPVPPPRILLGGASASVLDRVGANSYGWLPLAEGADAVELVGRGVQAILERRAAAGAPPAAPEVVLNAGRAEGVASELRALAAAGVSEVLVDGDFDEPGGPERALALLRAAEAEAGAGAVGRSNDRTGPKDRTGPDDPTGPNDPTGPGDPVLGRT